MTPDNLLREAILDAFFQKFSYKPESIDLQPTKKDFEGDMTFVLFPHLKATKLSPQALGETIGNNLMKSDSVVDFNVVSGFLNIVLSDGLYLDLFSEVRANETFGNVPQNSDDTIMVEFASPNTNKPLHLGHVRNVLLGYSVAKILEASGKRVHKTQIVNDRGIHICKSMVAWKHFGESQTPELINMKGDKFVGKYYVRFDHEYKKQIGALINAGKTEDEAKAQAPIFKEAQQMLLDWENGNPETLELWKTMNGWVYEGFEKTYKAIGVDFDSYYYESDTYLLGKEVVALGLEKEIFEKDPDGSVWIDLTEDGLDRKIVLRSDGTSVYMTQDIGTAIQRVKDCPDVTGMVYTVGNEQDYHFRVLFLILKKLGFDWAKNLFHLSYGMVDLPSGKMKSREGTVVDADDLLEEMTETAMKISEDLGKLDGYGHAEKSELYKSIGLAALKYYILKVDPKKRILFNPEESVDFAGNTGPFVQYTHARIKSILRKANFDYSENSTIKGLHPKEKDLVKALSRFPETIQSAAESHSPALIANYTYDLVKEYNSFYQTVTILAEADEQIKIFRTQLSEVVARTIKSAMELLGIEVPERM